MAGKLDEKIISILESQKSIKQQKELWLEQLADTIKEIQQGLIVQSGIELEQKHFFDNKLTIFMPKYIKQMTPAHIKIKYPNENRPKYLYTNDTDSMNIGVNLIADEDEKFTSDDVPDFRDIMMESFLSVSPSSKILDKGTVELEKDTEHEFLIAYYSFDSFAIGGAMYNLIFVTEIDGAIAIISLNCTMKDMANNEHLFYGIMHTVRVENPERG